MTKEELEKEAGVYADKHAFRVPYDDSNKFYDDVDFKASKDGYLAGAEPREKRIEELIALINAERERQEKCDDVHLRKIAELEKENAELKTKKIPQLERKIASIRGSHRADAKKLNARIEQAERLKKENAELKSIADFQTSSNMDRYFQLKRSKEQLTKARDIIKSLLTCCRNYPQENAEKIERAEQFLRDLEK